jgi:hypothetical protein
MTTHDVRGHFPYHEYPHPTNHTHPELAEGSPMTTRSLWHRILDFFLGHGRDCDERCGHDRACWP